jgi:hypothetical protein
VYRTLERSTIGYVSCYDTNDVSKQDSAFFRVLSSKKKISKSEANYMEVKRKDTNKDECICSKCKFNLGDEKKCHVVEGEFDNDHGISNFSPKGDGMVPGDIVWDLGG